MEKLMAILKNKKSLVSIVVTSIALFFVIFIISIMVIGKMFDDIPLVEQPASDLTEKSTVKSYLKYLSQPKPATDSNEKSNIKN